MVTESPSPTLTHDEATRDGAVLAHGALFNALAFLASNLRGIFTFLVARLLGSATLGTFGLAWATTDLVGKLATCGQGTVPFAGCENGVFGAYHNNNIADEMPLD